MKLLSIQKPEYRMIQVTPDRTVTNRDGYIFSGAMHDLYLPWNQRIQHIKKLKFSYMKKCRWWYVVELMKDKVCIYLVSADGEQSAFMEQRLNRYWPKATFKDAPFSFFVGKENVESCELKYRRHNIFALDCDRAQYTVPISDIMSVIRDMREDDVAYLVCTFEPYNRVSWSDRSDNAFNQFKTGKMPRRARVMEYIRPMAVLEKIDDTLTDVHSTLTAGIDSAEEAKKKDNERNKPSKNSTAKREVLQNGSLSSATNKKANQATFKTWIRVIVKSKDETRRKILLRTLSNSFSGIAGNNELFAKKIDKKATIDEFQKFMLSRESILDPDVNIMSTDEVGKIVQVPTASVQDEYKEVFESVDNREVELPKWITEGGIRLGEATFKGRKIQTYIQTKDHETFCLPWFAFGPQGVGKSLGIGVNTAVGSIEAGFSVFLIDVADGDLISESRDALPLWLPDDHIIDMELGHKKFAIPTTWSELAYANSGSSEDMNDAGTLLASQLVTFIDTIAKSQTTDRMSMYLKDAGKARFGRPEATPLDAMLMLTSKKYYTTHKQYIESARSKAKLESFWKSLSDSERQNIIRPIQTRISLLMDEERVADHTLQSDVLDAKGMPLINFRKWADGDKYPYFVGIRIPKDFFLEAGTDAVATFVISKLWLSILSRYDIPKDKRKPCVFIMDEPHQVPSSLELYKNVVRESRKWRLKLVWLGHTLEDFKDIIEQVRAAGCQYSQYKAKSEASLKMVLPEMAPFTREELINIPDKFFAVNRITAPGGHSSAPAFLAHMSPPPTRVKDRAYLREHWAMTLGRPRQEVRAMLMEKEKQYL